MNYSDKSSLDLSVFDKERVLVERIRLKANEWLENYQTLRRSAEMLLSSGDFVAKAADLFSLSDEQGEQTAGGETDLDGFEINDSDHSKLTPPNSFPVVNDPPAEQVEDVSEQPFSFADAVSESQLGESASFNRESKNEIPPGAFADVEKLLDALVRLTEMYRAPQTVAVMLADLKRGGFNFGQIKDSYANVRSTLRYYTKLFEKDGSQWRRKPQIAADKLPDEARQENNAIVSPQIVNEEDLKEAVDRQSPSSEAETAEAVDNKRVVSIFSRQSANQLIGVDASKAPESNTNGKKRILTYPQLCEEILLTSGQPWLHLDQFLVYLERDYGLKVEKAVIASALRKNAKARRRFKSHGGNRFGLIDQPEAARATA